MASLVRCSFADYPTEVAVEIARPTVPPLETMADGRAYLAVVRKELIAERDNLRYLDTGLAAAIVGGLVTTGLATTLKWGHHTQVTSGLLTAAVIGVDSTLSLKTQQLVINRGLDALLCVESQAEAVYLPVKAVDTVLAPVADDIHNLAAAIAYAKANHDPDLATIGYAIAELGDAEHWFSIVSVPVANVGAAVKIAVNAVLQTTIDQLNNALPDSSAFAKISLTPPSGSVQPQATPTPAPRIPPAPATSPAGYGYAPQTTGAAIPVHPLVHFVAKLHTDMAAAKAALGQLPPVTIPAALPTITCGVSGGPLVISPATLTLGPDPSTAAVSILGGTPPYVAEITTAAGSSGLNPDVIQVNVNGLAVTLKISKKLNKGPYNLVITDATGVQRTVVITAK